MLNGRLLEHSEHFTQHALLIHSCSGRVEKCYTRTSPVTIYQLTLREQLEVQFLAHEETAQE